MKTITLLNEKGGVGKTTLAMHLAAGLVLLGQRVLLIDADPQASATDMLRMPRMAGLYNLLIDDMEWNDLLPHQVSRDIYGFDRSAGEFWVLASDTTNSVVNMQARVQELPGDCLADRLQELGELMDYVIIDTAPSASPTHTLVHMASDYLLIPTQTNMLSLQGVRRTVSRMQTFNQARPSPAQIMGIIPTMHVDQWQADIEGMEQLINAFGHLVWPPMTRRTVWDKCGFAGELIFRFAPSHEAAVEMWNVVNRVLAHRLEHKYE